MSSSEAVCWILVVIEVVRDDQENICISDYQYLQLLTDCCFGIILTSLLYYYSLEHSSGFLVFDHLYNSISSLLCVSKRYRCHHSLCDLGQV
jgi:hypothetical protein